MSNSYRIRTQVGVDKSIKVLIDQDFEFLEILSLKVLQSQIYTRQCSDYGVLIGRVTTNNGFGVPNAKLSIFIPLDSKDENNPIISELYPYKKISDLNEDGFRYNLLPYTPSYSEHSATGSFPSREDVLTDPYLIEVFDKYYRYTARTNESGDFMIFGLPVGQHVLHLDVDLSDIGEFSLSPQDLVRMGMANETQVAGTKFKKSSNLDELPQIISIDRVVQVYPLWGQPDLCELGITRTDFDLTSEVKVSITPTAIFMGSIISSNNDQFQKRNCKPKLKQGNLCNLIAGPGDILAIRQTIRVDQNGRPGLETVDLDSGGKVIDENGTWLLDVPMNLDYITTNEFGERVISLDPKIGIPTKGKYRFKIKWGQPPALSEPIKRGYFLVPNIREHGWGISPSGEDPLKSSTASPEYQSAIKSYAFSLDWNDYADIQDAIDCKDTFYEMSYNKVYTVSQLITQFRKGSAPNRIIGIKDILSEECESENVKFPTNDAMFRFDIIFLLFTLLSYPFRIVFYLLVLVCHVLAFAMKFIILPIITVVVTVVFLFIVYFALYINGVISIINTIFSVNYLNVPSIADYFDVINKLWDSLNYFVKIPLPNLTYPDCELCSCRIGEAADVSPSAPSPYDDPAINNTIAQSTANKVLSEYTDVGFYTNKPASLTQNQFQSVAKLMAGQTITTSINNSNLGTALAPQLGSYGSSNKLFTSSLTLAERINLFNTKAKYFENAADNPYGGVNQIKVSFQPNTPKFHTDNIIVISCKKSKLSTFKTGQLITFQDIELSKDINLKGSITNDFGTNGIIGDSIGTVVGVEPNQFIYHTFNLNYTTPAGLTNTVTYSITGATDDAKYAKFAMDIEYFQVITAMTYNNFTNQCVSQLPNNFRDRYLNNNMRFEVVNSSKCYLQTLNVNPITSFKDYKDQVIVFLVRGVDPYTTRTDVSYDLSKIFGYNSFGNKVVKGKYKLNHPIQGGFKAVDHNITNSSLGDTSYSNQHLYYESFHFQPAVSGPGSFSGFTSDLPKYYSSLGNNLTYFTPSAPAPVMNFVFDTSSDSLMINYPTNYIGQEKSIVVPPPYWTCNFLNSNTNNLVTENRGYYDRERVEGGSAMYQILTLDPSDPLEATTYYYAPTYSAVSINYTLGSNNRQIIMRSDRLPTSTSILVNGNNSYALQNNVNFAAYAVSDSGYTTNSQGTLVQTPNGGGADIDPSELTGQLNDLFETLSCQGLVPLECYYYDNATGSFKVKPKTDGCYTNKLSAGRQSIISNGCFKLVTVIFLSLFRDFALVGEWVTRLNMSFGACRNVWSHMFTNNWINGTLYAFAIKNDRFFRVIGTQTTEPYSDYCEDTVVLHPTNNFYYRSSPYNSNINEFVGKKQSQSGDGNKFNLLFPTTIMDLGPRNIYIQELVMSDDYDGYVANKLNSTTYGDVSEILNYFILSRLINSNISSLLLGTNNAGILTYFNSRSKNLVDGDYAQTISVQSELGVTPFEAANYPDSTFGQNPIFSNGNATDVVIGIFFSSDTQTRDYITPRRTIVSPTDDIGAECTFSNIRVFTQEVPFYQWEVKKNNDIDSIFGSQENEWYTNPIKANGGFLKHNYQKMDRTLKDSRYFRPGTTLESQYFKGYIYSVTSTGIITSTVSTQDPNDGQPRTITTGAPLHFYFGLKQGKTAFDRFTTKWINGELIVE